MGLLRRIFGPKRAEVTGGWRKLNNEERINFYSSPYVTRVRWAGHVTRMIDAKCIQNVTWKTRREENRTGLGDLAVDGGNIKIDLK
jgi:hypothetical protein